MSEKKQEAPAEHRPGESWTHDNWRPGTPPAVIGKIVGGVAFWAEGHFGGSVVHSAQVCNLNPSMGRHRVYTRENDFEDFVAAVKRGQRCRIDVGIFDYFLGVIPPVLTVTLCDGSTRRVIFGFAEVAETIRVFWSEGRGRAIAYFAQNTNRIAGE